MSRSRTRGTKALDTRPISAVLAIAAYQMPVARDYHPGMGPAMVAPSAAPDTLEISYEARQLAARESEALKLWGEVRYDYPHTDDPDLPWETQHQQWTDLIAKVFGPPKGADEHPPDEPASS